MHSPLSSCYWNFLMVRPVSSTKQRVRKHNYEFIAMCLKHFLTMLHLWPFPSLVVPILLACPNDICHSLDLCLHLPHNILCGSKSSHTAPFEKFWFIELISWNSVQAKNMGLKEKGIVKSKSITLLERRIKIQWAIFYSFCFPDVSVNYQFLYISGERSE